MPCVVTGLDEDTPQQSATGLAELTGGKYSDGWASYVIDPWKDGQGDYINIPVDASLSPLKDAETEKWVMALPEGAKEFVILFSHGLIRRPCF